MHFLKKYIEQSFYGLHMQVFFWLLSL